MRKFSRDEFQHIALQNPLMEIIALTVAEVCGVTVEEMKSKSKPHHVVAARMIYAELCRRIVFPQYYIPFYLNRHDSVLSYWYETFNNLYDTDIAFAMLADKAKEAFNNKLNTLRNV